MTRGFWPESLTASSRLKLPQKLSDQVARGLVDARLRIRLRRQMIDHLGLLAAHELGERRLALAERDRIARSEPAAPDA